MALTIKDIAREAGYAISTVSRVLNNHPDVSQEARERILAVVEEMGFVPNSNAKSLKQQTAKAVCILVKGRSNLLFATIVEQMQEIIEQAGYAVVPVYIDEDDDEVAQGIRVAAEAKPLGLIFLGGTPENFKRGFKNISLPCVLVTNPAGALGFDNLSSVTSDDANGAEQAINYLLGQGHHHIGILGGNLDTSYTSQLRHAGCLQAFTRAGLKYDCERQYQKTRYAYQSAYKNMLLLQEKYPELTAVFCMSDKIAVGAVRALLDSGRQVPQDVSVMGYDGTEMAEYYNPKLATIRQDADTLAWRGAQIMLRIIQDGGEAVHEIVGCKLIRGDSVALLPRS